MNNDHWEIDNRLSSYLFLDTSTQRYKFIYDRNRAKWIQLFDIDISALCSDLDAGRISASDWAAWQHTINCNFYWQGDRGNGNPNYRVAADGGHDIRDNYVTDRKDNAAVVNVPVVDYGVRIVNAKNLPAGGLSIISPYPLYIQGDFNSDTKEPKAFIAADSITLLTDQWTDWRSSMDFGNSYLYQNKNWQYGLQRVDSNANDQQTIYAHIMTGRTHPHYWLTNETNIYPDLGIHDAFRTLEDHRTPIKLCGSLILPYYSQWQWEPPINFCHYTRTPVSYAPANIYLDGTEWSKMRPTANMPFYHKINRGRKTQSIGESAYSVLNTIYSKDTTATSYTFDSYKNDLPNYLQ